MKENNKSQESKTNKSTDPKVNRFTVVILAAGQGKRMKSPLPKVLHPVAGYPMVSRVVSSVKMAGATDIRVVVGHGENLVRQVLEPMGVSIFKQVQQNGTADAVRSADIDSMEGPVLILNGDHPLITPEDIKRLREDYTNGTKGITVATAKLKKPAQFGRIIRKNGEVVTIVEARDASHDTLKINEINTGIYLLDASILKKLLPLIENRNSQKEFYFTDIINLAKQHNYPVHGVVMPKHVARGVNSQQELAQATKNIFLRNVKRHLENGVMFIDPSSAYVEDEVYIGSATVVYPNVFIKSGTQIGSFCVLESNTYLSKVSLEDSVQIRGGSYLEECVIRNKAIVGPYARIRPGSDIGVDARIGNFVELKNAKLDTGAKANHLTYLGDVEIGEGTNIGCGTITCNYAVDKKKYKTKIGKNVFVGSDSQFIAPVTIGDNAVIGSGSTITKDVPSRALAVARGKQFIKENYAPVFIKEDHKSEHQQEMKKE
jgi:bifunctional UDP-N-acetylglucosamine pyrophosphorylase/glucosamine-1-phosphate N-acetyltransferase